MALRPYDDIDESLATSSKQQSFFFFSTVALAATISIFGIIGGFIYGDYYGRQHAQFDSVELRKHYAGECYSYVDTQLKKTIKTSFDKQGKTREQTERLEDIRNLIINLHMDINGLGMGKKAKERDLSMKKKVATAAQ
jgi:hypothetical protein